jgi:hypothetical protein
VGIRGQDIRRQFATLFLLAVVLAVPALMIAWPLQGEREGANPGAAAASQPPQEEDVIPAQGARWPVELGPADAGYLTGLLFDCLDALNQAKPLPEVQAPPEACARETGAPLFVTVYAPRVPAFRALGREKRLADSVQRVAQKVFSRFAGRVPAEALRLRLDVLVEARPFPVDKRRIFAAHLFDRPLGVAVKNADKLSVFLAADMADCRAGTNLDALHVACRDAGLDPSAWQQPSTAMWRLETVGFVNEDQGSRRVLASPRGLTPMDEVTVPRALRAARLAAGYLMRARVADGSFVTYWNPASELLGGCEDLSEQAAAAAALGAMCEFRPDKEAVEACHRAVSHLMQYTDVDEHNPMLAYSRRQEVCRVVWELDATAHVLEALCRYRRASGLDEPAPWIRCCADFLLFMQKEDGLFELCYDGETRLRMTPRAGQGNVVPQAKAVHALCLAYRELQEPRYLSGARKALDALLAPGQRGTTGDAGPGYGAAEARWLASAVQEFTAFVPAPTYQAWVGRMAAARRQAQLTADASPAADLTGGTLAAFPPKAGPTADDLAVFVSACMMDVEGRAENLAAARQAALYLMRLQYLPENSYYLPDPAVSAGGFREQPGLNIIRLQTMESALQALVKLCRLELSELGQHD